MKSFPPLFKRIILDTVTIQRIVSTLAQQLNHYYRDSKLPVVCIGVMDGCCLFITDLLRQVNFATEVYFVHITSYVGTKAVQTPLIQNAAMFQNARINNRHILLVDEIIDTSATLSVLKDFLTTNFQPLSLKTVALIAKKKLAVQQKLTANDLIGTYIDNVFVVGYGLDYHRQFRFYPMIGEFNLAWYEEKFGRYQT